ncbi:MAG: hypothetical protein ACYSTZ_06275 [Planctomycetota bacterium]|jgi:hypothetical protein
MSPKKIIFIVPLIFLAVVVYELSHRTKVEVENGVRPYLERFLGLTIEKDYEVIYDKYLHERALPFENFCARMNYFSKIFGAEPASFSYEHSYVGGEGYYIVYRLVLSDDKSYPCSFEFPAKETSPIRIEDLQAMSVSADYGEKSFQIYFKSGNVLACKAPEGCVEPSGPIARSGSTPTIDGVFEDGEWDDAEVVQAGKYQQFRLKHDSTNLYFAVVGDGGNLWFNKDKGLHVLHASAQLCSAEYTKSDTPAQLLDKAFVGQLYGVQNESATDINEKMTGYLAENGWVGSIGGNKAQTEFAVSFNWLGVTIGSERFVEIPVLYLYSGRHFSPEEIEKLRALSLEERKEQYPTLYWPVLPVPNDSLNSGYCPETISFDPTDWGRIWIDLGDRATANQ